MILVTGASGYIGYILTKELLKENNKVRAFCHNKTEKMNRLKNEYSESLEICYGDISKIENFNELLKNIDVIYHLAAELKLNENMEEINTNATKKVFENCLRYNVKKVVFFSTVAVYKTGEEISINSYKEPNNMYGRTKLEAEKIGQELYKKKGLPLIVLEPSIVYGEIFKGTIGKIENRANNGYCLRVGNGKYKNSIIHVNDLVKIAINVTKNDNYIGKTIICTAETISVCQVNNILKKYYGKAIKEIYIPDIMAKIIMKFPVNKKLKIDIGQLIRNSEYKSTYEDIEYIKFEQYIAKKSKK